MCMYIYIYIYTYIYNICIYIYIYIYISVQGFKVLGFWGFRVLAEEPAGVRPDDEE